MFQNSQCEEFWKPASTGVGVCEEEESTAGPPEQKPVAPQRHDDGDAEGWAALGATGLRADGRRKRDEGEDEFDDDDLGEEEDEFDDDEGLDDDFDDEFDDDEDLDSDVEEDLEEEDEL